MTNISTQNAEWLANRPMWQVDKQDAALLKHPKRWLGQCNAWDSKYTPRRGWLNRAALRDIKRHEEIQNSKSQTKMNIFPKLSTHEPRQYQIAIDTCKGRQTEMSLVAAREFLRQYGKSKAFINKLEKQK